MEETKVDWTKIDWKAYWRLVDRRGDDALCVHVRDNGSREFVVARGYDDETGHWASGEYFESLALAAGHLEGRAVSTVDSSELVLASYWTREDIRTALGDFDVPVTEENVDMVVERLGLDGGWDAFETLKSPFNEELCMTGNEFIAEEVAWMRKEMGEGGTDWTSSGMPSHPADGSSTVAARRTTAPAATAGGWMASASPTVGSGCARDLLGASRRGTGSNGCARSP